MKSRAEAMQKASDLSASALYFIAGIPQEELSIKCTEIMDKIKTQRQNPKTFAGIAIDSYHKGCVVGATIDCEKDILGLASDMVSMASDMIVFTYHDKPLIFSRTT